jgi:parallel beta-helix repeat protein
VIKVAAGTYTGVSARAGVTQTVYISKTVTIQGGYTTTNWNTSYPITQPTTLDALRQGRVLYIAGDPSAGRAISPTIEGLRITNGNAGDASGGGVYVISATVTLNNNQVFNNTADADGRVGGGVYLLYSDATLSENTIISNTARGAVGGGGGLCSGYGSVTLVGNTVRNNVAVYGGGLFVRESDDAVFSGNTVSANTATQNGGGLALWDSNNTSLSENTIISNTAKGDGGGLHLWDRDATISDNVIISNTAASGGGLYLSNDHVSLNGNTVSSNTANGSESWNGRGGGLYLSSASILLTNNVIVDNRANNGGNGLYIGESARLLHTTIARNNGGDGSGVYVSSGTVALTNTILVSHTVGITVPTGTTAILTATLWGDGAWANGDNWGGAGAIISNTNVTGDPAFVDPDNGDYHISVNSDAIDAGVNGGVDTDIDGDPRPLGTGYDIGADECTLRYVYLPVVVRQYP